MNDYRMQPPITFSPSELYESIKKRSEVVLCGKNNCGKTLLLKNLVAEYKEEASYLGPQRFHNFNTLSAYGPNPNRKTEKWRNLYNHIFSNEINNDSCPINLQQAIAELSNAKRKILFDTIRELLGSNISIESSIPDNDMSHKYVSVDGYNLSFTSSGFRLFAIILTSLLDDDYKCFFIDEPELGLSPNIQGILRDFLFDAEKRKEKFPHIEKIAIATHSNLFLDKRNFNNNYFLEKNGNSISIRQITTIQELNKLQFFLLGNRFESLLLPSVIILTEGISDYNNFIKRVISVKYPNHNISVTQCNGDSKIKEYVHFAQCMLNDIRKSPYSDRIFIVLDLVHGADIISALERQGIANDNIIRWDNNGIEFCYPKDCMKEIFGEYDKLIIKGDVIEMNGIRKTKNELSELISSRITEKTEYCEEFKKKFINKIETKLF